jgi:dihydroorotate dehydrogenase
VTLAERLGLAGLRCLDPELAHRLALRTLRLGLAPLPGPVASPRLRTRLAGLDLPNPVGLAPGFDKNAVAVAPLMQAGFGFLELGGVTPLPQPGNPRPRLFRLPEDAAVINRMGFNNDGMEAVADRLALRPSGIPVGLNLGANKASADRADDYARVLARCAPYLDFAVVNVSSPNTERLRELQGAEALAVLLHGVVAARGTQRLPIFVKIAPELTPAELEAVIGVVIAARADGLVCTNTTLARDGLASRRRGEAGGLSGRPLFERSTRVLALAHEIAGGKLPLIGVGGIGSAADAYAKIRAGASAVQLYTALAFRGLSLASEIAQGLDALLASDGFASPADAVGTDLVRWL